MATPNDRTQGYQGSALCARTENLPNAMIHHISKSERQVSAALYLCPEEEAYVRRALQVWDRTLQGTAWAACQPRPHLVSLEPPYLTRRCSPQA